MTAGTACFFAYATYSAMPYTHCTFCAETANARLNSDFIQFNILLLSALGVSFHFHCGRTKPQIFPPIRRFAAEVAQIYQTIGWNLTFARRGDQMTPDEITEHITRMLQKGISESIEQRDIQPIKSAAIEAYRFRTGNPDLKPDDAVTHHIFPSDVEQTLQLSLQIVETDKEKASVLYKGAIEQIMNRLAVVLPNEQSRSSSSWKFWKRSGS
jgi:hypothetical protein